MFSVFGKIHGWLIPDNVRLANSFVHLSADWPSDYAVYSVPVSTKARRGDVRKEGHRS